MTLPLGLRTALAGRREGVTRLCLIAAGVGVGVALLLLTLTVVPAFEGRAERAAWQHTSGRTPATASDAALWLAVSDHHAGTPLLRVYVAPLGPRPPVPPGLDRLPVPGEVVVSPALARRLESTPDDQLDDRLPGRVTGRLGPEGLAWPDQLVAVIGTTPEALAATGRAERIRGIEVGSEAVLPLGAVRFLLTLGAVALLVPVVIFIALVTRVGAARREERLAAMRLVGATRLQTATIAAVETGLAGVAGSVIGVGVYLAARPVVAATVTYDGARFWADDIQAPPGQLVAVLVGVPVLAMLTTLASLRRVQVTPLGIGRRAAPPRPRARRALPAAIGAGGLLLAGALRGEAVAAGWLGGSARDTIETVMALLLALTLAGLVVAGPWLCLMISRALARGSRRATTLVAARRIATDPATAYRAVSGVVIAVFVTTMFSSLVTAGTGERGVEFAGALRPGVVEVYLAGEPAARVAALVDDGVVVTRAGRVACGELARVVYLACPPARRMGDDASPAVRSLVLGDPGPADGPVHSLFVPTDGSLASEERVRTRAAALVPTAIVTTHRDMAVREARTWTEIDTALRLALVFVLFVAACSLTVAVVGGLIERRRPFALLRASGMRLSELRRIVMLETAAPLAVTALTGFGLGLLTSYALGTSGGRSWTPPSWTFVGSLGVGLVAALAVTTLTLPLIDATTRLDAVRYE